MLRQDGRPGQKPGTDGRVLGKVIESGEKGQRVYVCLFDPNGLVPVAAGTDTFCLPLTRTSSGLVMTEDQNLKHHQTPVSMQLAVQASLV